MPPWLLPRLDFTGSILLREFTRLEEAARRAVGARRAGGLRTDGDGKSGAGGCPPLVCTH